MNELWNICLSKPFESSPVLDPRLMISLLFWYVLMWQALRVCYISNNARILKHVAAKLLLKLSNAVMGGWKVYVFLHLT